MDLLQTGKDSMLAFMHNDLGVNARMLLAVKAGR
jgi:hypothetical protein